MKGGTTVPTSQTKHTDGLNTKKPTAEQIRYAQLLNTEDSKAMRDKIKQVADVTGYNYDVVSIALHDCNFDTEATINALLEGRQDQSEWVMRTNKKKKSQTPVTQGIDTIIPTSQTTPSTTTAPTSSKPGGQRPPRGKGRNRQTGEQNNSSDKDSKNEGAINNNDRNPGESGRGRGSREDRWNDRKPGGRGGPPRRGGRGGGRPGRSFQSRGRDRHNRFGGGNRNTSNTTAVNGPTVNGTEIWGENEDDVSKEKEAEQTGEVMPPTTEEWGVEEWTPVEQSTTSSTHDTLFNNAVSTSHSWPASSDSSGVTWDVDTPSVNNSTVPAVPTSDSRQKAPENTAHFKPESVDMAIIHSKLASNQPTSKEQFSAVDFSLPRIPLPGELQNLCNNHDSITKLLDKVVMSSSVGMAPQNSSTTIQAQPQRQPRTSRPKKSQKSQIPVQAVEMPGSMNDNLDVQFGNLEFGGDSVSSPRKKEEFPTSLPVVEDTKSDEQSSSSSSESPSPPLEPPRAVTSLPSSPITTPLTITTSASASSSVTTLEESSPRHFQHPSPRSQQQSLVSQVTKQITPEPIPLPPQLDSRENIITSKSPLSNDQQKSSPSLQSSSIPSPSLSGANLTQSGSSSPLRPALSSSTQKDITLETRAYQKHHVTQPTVPSTKDKLGTSSLSSSAVSTTVPRNDLSSAEPLPPPPGVSVPLTVNQTTTTSSGFTTVTMSGTGKPVSHTTKPSLPPGVLPLNTLYGMQQGLIHAYPLPYGYEDLQRLQMSPYYDMPAFQAAGRDGLSTTFHGDQKFGRTDASSPVPSSLNQAVTLPQAHLQQQAFINATTMPHPYGYGGLAFYPGAGMMPGGFPAYTTPMYQMPTKTHGNASQYQSAYTSGQHGTHNFASGYDDLGQTHDFGKSGYHTSVSPSQSKSNSGAAVSSASDLSGASYKPQVGKFNDNKPYIGGTPPPPALNLSMTGQHGPLGSYPHTGHPFMSMMTPVQQHHPPSHYHHHMAHHMETGQPGASQRGSQGQGPKQGQSKGHQGGYQGSPFWSGTN